MSETELLERLLREVEATNQLLRVLVQPTLRAALLANLPRTVQRRAYELSDGNRGTREIAQEVGVSAGSISNWWKTWRIAGIANEDAGGRVRHVMPLSAIGIAIEAE